MLKDNSFSGNQEGEQGNSGWTAECAVRCLVELLLNLFH